MAMSDFDEDILNDFLTESLELIDELDGDLVSLEANAEDTELLNRIFRALHTIKGSASFLAITNLVNFAHAAEDALNVIRRHEVRVNQPVMDALLRSVDVLRTQFDALQAGAEPAPGPEDLVAALHEIAAGRAPQGAGAVNTPAAADPGHDAPPAPAGGAVAIAESQPQSSPSGDPADEDAASPGPTLILGVQRLSLGSSKSDLLGYMVEDFRDSVEQLGEEVARLSNSGQRHEAGLQLAELAEGLGRIVEFFDCESLARLVSILEVAGEHVDDVSDAALSQALPRLRTVLHLLESQCPLLGQGEIFVYDISLLSERLVDLVLGHELPPEAVLPSEAAVADVMRIDQVRGGPATSPEGATASAAAEASVVANPTPSAADSVRRCGAGQGEATAVVGDARAVVEAAADEDDGAPSIEVPRTTRKIESTAGDDDEEDGTTAASGSSANDRGTRSKGSGTGSAGGAANGKSASKLEATIRVEVRRLEALQNLVGELVIQKNRLVALSRQVAVNKSVDNNLREAVQAAAGDLDRVTGEIQVGVMRTRMQPLDKLFGKYPRLVRDLARSTGKKIHLEIEGGDTEVDRSVLEELGDPLVHILRNSADHGVEPPADRLSAGKAETGCIVIAAEHQGGHVVIRVRDDGRGINRQRVAAKAVERGLVTADEIAGMSDREILNLVMMPGFSLAEKVSDLSGRGVGMDVVKTNIQALGGQVELESTEGQGTTITIKIPLTIAIMNAMMVRVEREMYAIPLTSILEIVRPESKQIKTVRGNPVMRLRDSVLPLIDLADEFNIRTPDTRTPFAVVVGVGDQRAGLLVSHLIGQQEIVIKPLDEDAKSTDAISGATVRDDGGVSLILDVARLIEGATRHARQAA